MSRTKNESFLPQHVKIIITMAYKIKGLKRNMTTLEHTSKSEVSKKEIVMALLAQRCDQ